VARFHEDVVAPPTTPFSRRAVLSVGGPVGRHARWSPVWVPLRVLVVLVTSDRRRLAGAQRPLLRRGWLVRQRPVLGPLLQRPAAGLRRHRARGADDAVLRHRRAGTRRRPPRPRGTRRLGDLGCSRQRWVDGGHAGRALPAVSELAPRRPCTRRRRLLLRGRPAAVRLRARHHAPDGRRVAATTMGRGGVRGGARPAAAGVIGWDLLAVVSAVGGWAAWERGRPWSPVWPGSGRGDGGVAAGRAAGRGGGGRSPGTGR
jgi:hypothetical protein